MRQSSCCVRPVALTVQFSAGGGFGGGYPSSLMGTVAYIRQSFYDAFITAMKSSATIESSAE